MSYIGNSPQTITRIDFIFTATDGQTVFSGADNYSKVLTFNVNEHDVYVNGRLIDKSDYSADGSSVTFVNGRVANDLVMVRAMGVYQIADFYTKSESDSGFIRYNIATSLSNSQKLQAQSNIGLKATNFGRVRLAGTNGYGSTNNKIRRFGTVVKNEGSDITYTDSASLGASFTINNDGLYSIAYTAQFSAAAHMSVSLNSTQLTTPPYSLTDGSVLAAATTSAGSYAGSVSCSLFLVAGDIVRVQTDGTSAGIYPSFDKFSIERIG